MNNQALSRMETLTVTPQKPRLYSFLISCLLGASTVFCFAPYQQGWLAIPILTCLLLISRNTHLKHVWRLGYSYGLGLFTHGTWWIYISIHTPSYGLDSKPLAILFALAFILWLALFPAIAIYLSNRLRLSSALCNAFITASIWLITEKLRATLLTGYPWMAIGDSQLLTPLHTLYPLVGSEGISFLLVFLATLMTDTIRQKSWWPQLLTLTSIAACLMLAPLIPTEWTKQHSTLKVALNQQNIALKDKWLVHKHASIMKSYRRSAKKAIAQGVDLILWPEAAIPHPDWVDYGLPTLVTSLKDNDTTLIAGIPLLEKDQAYNGAIALGANTGSYKKQHLVPFGEYWPMQAWLGKNARFFDMPMSMYSKGPKQQKPFIVDNTRIALLICYEITYANLVRSTLGDSNLLVTITDDAWFGDSIARDQHLEIAQIRSKELGRAQAFVANTGITAAINAQGEIIDLLAKDKAQQLIVQLDGYAGETPLQYFGTRWLYYLAFVIVLAAFITRRQSPYKCPP